MVIWGILSLNLILTVALFQANVLTWDQWDFYAPLFGERGMWAVFDFQHGPHRQGLGFVVTSWILAATQWDTRIDSLWIVFLLSLSSALALRLKWKITGELGLKDVWIPVLGLTLAQFEAILITPNSSHSAFPLALMLGIANLWLVERPAVRYLVGGGAAVGLTFTGFGLFAGAIITLLLGAWLLRHALRKEWKLAALAAGGFALAAAGWILFCSTYVFAPAVAGFRFPWTPVTDYLRFTALMLLQPSGVFGETGPRYAAGGWLGVMMVSTAVACASGWIRSRQPTPAEEMILLLVVAGALFVVSTAVGRVCLGITAGMSSRYVTLMFPLWVGVNLYASTSGKRGLASAAILSMWCLAAWPYAEMRSRPINRWPGTIGATHDQIAYFEQYTSNKAGWVDTYLKTNLWEAAQTEYGIVVYPDPAATHLADKLAFLRAHRLSFLAERPRPSVFLPLILPDRFIWNDEFPTSNSPNRVDGKSKLTFVTKKTGYMELSWGFPDRTAPFPKAEIDLEYRGKKQVVSIDHVPFLLTVPVDCGYNTITLAPAKTEPPFVLQPPHFIGVPAVGSRILE